MPEYIVNLWLDGYDTEEQMEKACDEFIYDQLNFTASSVRVKRSDYSALLARHNALVDAVAWLRGVDDVRERFAAEFPWIRRWSSLDQYVNEARSEVDRLIADCKGEG